MLITVSDRAAVSMTQCTRAVLEKPSARGHYVAKNAQIVLAHIFFVK